MGRQSSRIYFQGKDHKDIYFQGHYHDKMYIGSQLVWEKLSSVISFVKWQSAGEYRSIAYLSYNEDKIFIIRFNSVSDVVSKPPFISQYSTLRTDSTFIYSSNVGNYEIATAGGSDYYVSYQLGFEETPDNVTNQINKIENYTYSKYGACYANSSRYIGKSAVLSNGMIFYGSQNPKKISAILLDKSEFNSAYACRDYNLSNERNNIYFPESKSDGIYIYQAFCTDSDTDTRLFAVKIIFKNEDMNYDDAITQIVELGYNETLNIDDDDLYIKDVLLEFEGTYAIKTFNYSASYAFECTNGMLFFQLHKYCSDGTVEKQDPIAFDLSDFSMQNLISVDEKIKIYELYGAFFSKKRKKFFFWDGFSLYESKNGKELTSFVQSPTYNGAFTFCFDKYSETFICLLNYLNSNTGNLMDDLYYVEF